MHNEYYTKMELIRHKKSHGFYQNLFLDLQNSKRFIALTVFNWFQTDVYPAPIVGGIPAKAIKRI